MSSALFGVNRFPSMRTVYMLIHHLLDVMQNHLLQVLTLLAMDRPISFSAEDIRDEKVRVLKAMPAISPKDVIIGQYDKSLDGSKPGYKEDETVPKDSRCPTFASMVAWVKNERWDGVPFILKAGKGDDQNCSQWRIFADSSQL